MIWIDTHCHLDHKQFKADRGAVLQDALDLGMAAMIVPAISYESNFTIRQDSFLMDKRIFFSVGIHPNHVEEALDPEKLEQYIDDRTVAIGETGLDYFRTRQPEKQALQRKLFRRQIDMAQRHGLPLILHIREAWEDGLEVLRSCGEEYAGVAHCFAGTWEQAKAYLEMGFALGVGGLVTKEAPGLVETVGNMPLEKLLLETDAPFLAPTGCKGRNVPANIPRIAQAVAEIRDIPVEIVMEATTRNTKRIFRLNMD